MKRLTYFALAALVGAWGCSSDKTTETPVTGTISGTVSIEGSGASGVTVSLSSGASTTTGSDGTYAFTSVAAGAYTVTISDFPTDVTFSSTSKGAAIQTTGQTVPVDFNGSYIRTSSIVGNVSAGGAGVAGVSVEATGPSGTASKVTDANGNYTFTGLRAGDYTVTISDVPSGYTFTTTSKTVTVGVGATEQAQFTGTEDVQEVTASVVIKSVTTGVTNVPVNPAAVVGQIDVTLQIDPGTNQLSNVCVKLDDVNVPNGCQTLSSAVAAEGPDGVVTFEPVFSLLTAAFDAVTGIPSWLDVNHTLSAVVGLTNAAEASVSTSMQLTFANPDRVVATITPGSSAVGTQAPNAGRLFFGMDQVVNLLPVLYSGKTLATATVGFYTGAIAPALPVQVATRTAASFPGSVTFRKSTELAGYSSPAASVSGTSVDLDFFQIVAALYTDGTSATPVLGTMATGPNGATVNIDEVAPPVVALNLTDQTAVVAGVGAPTLACCANNWVGAEYEFADGLAATPVDNTGEAGVASTIFYIGAPALTNAQIIAAGVTAETGADAGLPLSFVNTENTVVAVYTDGVGNASNVRLSGLGANTLTTFGFDNTMPTAFAVAAGSEPNQIIYNIANPGPGLGVNFGATEDRAGFSAVPISGYLARMTKAGTTYPLGQTGTGGVLVGPINMTLGSAFSLPPCVAAPANAAPCYPTSVAWGGDALWLLDATAQDQAGNRVGTHIQRMVLADGTAPLTQNVALPPQVIAGSPVTYSAPVTDTHELWSVAFGTDFGGDGIFLPFGENVMVGDGNRWDDNFITSATAVLTLNKAIVARERANLGCATDCAPSGTVNLATNVRAVTTDAAGNQSAPLFNNFIAGTVDPTAKATSFFGATPATQTTNWQVTAPAAAVTLCNGQGGTACNTTPGPDVLSTTMTIVAQGASGVYNNPFGAAGTIYIYVNIPTGGYYTAGNTWYLVGNIPAAGAAITDDGLTRTYTWSFTVTSAMVAQIANGTAIDLVAMGLNDTTGTLLVSEPNVNVTVVNGT